MLTPFIVTFESTVTTGNLITGVVILCALAYQRWRFKVYLRDVDAGAAEFNARLLKAIAGTTSAGKG